MSHFQSFNETTNEGKNALILRELDEREGKVIVFTRTKSRTDRLARMITKKGHDVVSLHGGRSQGQRKTALERFRSGSHRILVATDLAGRGIDVDDIQHVINYDVPATREDYIHRIGRTGRCGKTGNALSFLVTGDFEGEKILAHRVFEWVNFRKERGLSHRAPPGPGIFEALALVQLKGNFERRGPQ